MSVTVRRMKIEHNNFSPNAPHIMPNDAKSLPNRNCDIHIIVSLILSRSDSDTDGVGHVSPIYCDCAPR
jgi:hypothetical protein